VAVIEDLPIIIQWGGCCCCYNNIPPPLFRHMQEVDTARNFVRTTVNHGGDTYVRSQGIHSFQNFFSSKEGNPVYFKAGAYMQLHARAELPARLGSGSGQVSIRSISVKFGEPGKAG
jgi:hypothetical protein